MSFCDISRSLGSRMIAPAADPLRCRRSHGGSRRRAAGMGDAYSGHSGRVGMGRRMASKGAPTHESMAQGR